MGAHRKLDRGRAYRCEGGSRKRVASVIIKANYSIPIRLAKLARFFKTLRIMKTTTLPLRNLMNRSPLRTFLLIPFVLGCFALSPAAQAECREGCSNFGNTFLGEGALSDNTTGSANTAVGSGALSNNSTGTGNTAEGNGALGLNTTGGSNTAIGSGALTTNFTGNNNTATGGAALLSNVSGSSNTANGFAALQNNEDGNENTATGYFALSSNTSGSQNTANGVNALYSNTGGVANTATGDSALESNFGHFNTANGWVALQSNTSGNNNTACGVGALFDNTIGENNIALGADAGHNLTTGSNNIDIGNEGARGESATIRIGTQGTQTKTFIAGISGAAIRGMEVRVNQNGRLGTAPSSERFKELIKPMDKASAVLLALRPVTFRYKPDIDPEGVPQFGLVAEEVEKVNPDLVARDEEGKPYSVRYDAVNAMLLNEFLKEHRTVQELKSTAARQEANAAKQEATIARQQKQIEALVATVKEQATQIQKVSAQLGVNKTAPQIVLNNQ
jgi:hypothetical protein